MKASDYIASFLKGHGIDTVFEMSGGMITHLLDSLHKVEGIRIVTMHHEQSAAFAVDAYSRIKGLPGVALATSGPGATNLLTGIGSCYFDSTPGIFITGQVNRHEQKAGRQVRQLGFQETDIVAMAKPVTKKAWLVNNPDELPSILDDAFRVAMEGRPGPVLLDVPMDVQRCNIEGLPAPYSPSISPLDEDTVNTIRCLLNDRKQAQRPLILVGGGIRCSQSAELARHFIHKLKVPVVNSLMGVDVLPASNPLHAGLIGSYGNRWANHAMGRADFLIVLGSRLDVRQTGSETEAFAQGKRIYHIDCDAAEINNRILGCIPIVAELKAFLNTAIDLAGSLYFDDHLQWISEIDDLRSKWPDTKELDGVTGINPNVLMNKMSQYTDSTKAFVTDVGQHQMWAAQSVSVNEQQRFLTSGGMGAMGFGLPAAIGASIAAGNQQVVLIAGDGGFQTNIQELQTVVRNKLPIKMIIINNNCHGMVRQFQQSYFHERYQSTLWGYSAPDFEAVAKSYGIDACSVKAADEIANAFHRIFENPLQPALLQVYIDTYTNVYPKLAFGRPMTEMEPFAKPLEMEGT